MGQPKRGSGALVLLGALLCGMALAAAPPTEPARFVLDATQAGMLEVEAGNVAMNASTNALVKTFAERMITDHQQANEELAVIARKKSIAVPTELDPGRAARLKALRGKSARDFDAAYAALMVREHARAVELFQSNISSEDGELAAFVGKTLPVLQEHSHLADNLQINLQTGRKKK